MKLIKLQREFFWAFIQFPRNLWPSTIRKFADPESYYIDKMLKIIPPALSSSLALDAGAGDLNKRDYLISKGYTYESCDFENVFTSESSKMQTYICNLYEMPMEDSVYDLVICVQVLEHVNDPGGSINEIFRVLKDDGLIFLSTNFMYPRHGQPYDFFRFTEDGLIFLFEKSGFEVERISSHGGFPALCAQILHEIPLYVRNFIIFGRTNPSKEMRFKLSRTVLLVFSIIPIMILNLCTQILAFIFHVLDNLDKNKRYTLGYSVIARKPNQENSH